MQRAAAAATFRQTLGGADRRRPTALLVARPACFALRSRACGAMLLAPCGPRREAQRGRGRLRDGL